MAKAITSYEANDGSKHLTASDAAAADLAALLGHRESTHAKIILEKRAGIVAIFAELDALEKRASGPRVAAVG